ncbi:MAG TPA: LPS assembly protein LptD [Steroidobacteraceae bacterium]|nr:LPS assembly protein LptD [Steroidobacteraceae bacterium]
MLKPRPPYLLLLAASVLASAAHAGEPSCPTSASKAPAATAATQAAREAKRDVPFKIDPGGKVEIQTDSVIIQANGDTDAQGGVTVKQGDREIHADDAHFDAGSNGFTVKGPIEYQDSVVKVTGTGGRYSPTGGADVNAAQFELPERSARGSAKSVTAAPNGIVQMKEVQFTTCPKEDESWKLHAGSLTMDTNERVATGRNATVEFEGVPIFYLPWASFPLGDQRKSGFLFPSIGSSSSSGLQLGIPYYWNIAPNADFTFDPLYYSHRGIDLGGDARYMTSNQTGELSWHYLPNDQRFGQDRSFVTLRQTTELTDDLRLRLDAGNVSDPHYFEDFGQGPETTSVAFVDRLAILSYRDDHWRVNALAQQYQTIDTTLPAADRPYAQLPAISASSDYGLGPERFFRYGFDSEVVDFTRDGSGTATTAAGLPLVTGWRIDVRPRIGFDYDAVAYFIRSSFAWRYTQYELDNNAPGTSRSPSRTLPIASLDTGLRFERLVGAQGVRTLTLEPRLLYLYVPYRNQDSLPVFDTALPDLNLVELFRTNRFVGADRVGDADQLSVGITSRLLDTGSGQQFIAATLGQTYYFETPRVQLPGPAGTVPVDRSSSDAVAELQLTAYKHWNVNLGLQWDPEANRSDRTFVQLQYKPAQDSVVNLAYRYQRGQLEQGEVSGAWPVTRSLDVLARMVYAFDTHEGLDRFLGFQYHSCCWSLRLLGRRYLRTSTGRQDTGVLLQLELNGLASVGSAPDSFLGTAIRGYSRSTPTP